MELEINIWYSSYLFPLESVFTESIKKQQKFEWKKRQIMWVIMDK